MDSTEANLLYEIYTAYWNVNNYDSGLVYAQKCLTISQNCGYKKGIGNAYYAIGLNNSDRGNYTTALEYFQKSLTIREESRDKAGIAASCIRIGFVHQLQADYPVALKNYLKAIKIKEEIGDKDGLAYCNLVLANFYGSQGNYKEALSKDKVALKMYTELGNKKEIAKLYYNMGLAYTDTTNYREALKCILISLQLSKEIDNKQLVGVCYSELGEIYNRDSNYSAALINYQAGLKILEEIGDKLNCENTYNSMSDAYKKQGDLHHALFYATKALSLSLEIKGSNTMGAYQNLADIDVKLNDYKSAYENEVLFKKYYDTVYNEENEKKITGLLMKYDFDKKQDSIKSAEIIIEATFQRKEQEQYLGILTIVLLFISFAFLGSRFQLSLKVIDYTGFVGVLLFFEFLHVLLHPIIERYSTGYPIIFMAINISLAAAIKPLHNIVQKRVISAAHNLKEKRQLKAALIKVKAQKAAEELALKKTQPLP